MSEAASDEVASSVASLDEILTRLAMAKAERLPAIAPKLLPRLLEQLSSKHGQVRAKAVEVLSHLNMRIRDDVAVRLPLEALLRLLLRFARQPLVRNTTLMYVSMAAERCAPEELALSCGTLLEAAAVSIETESGASGAQSLSPGGAGDDGSGGSSGLLLRLLARSIAEVPIVRDSARRKRAKKEITAMVTGAKADDADAQTCSRGDDDADADGLGEALADARKRQIFLFFAKHVLLYEPLLSPNAAEAMEGGSDGARAEGHDEDVRNREMAGEDQQGSIHGSLLENTKKRKVTVQQGGLSQENLLWLRGGKLPLSDKEVTRIKLGVLSVLSALGTQDVLVHLIISLSDSKDSVKARAEDLLRRPTSPPDFEDVKVLQELNELFHGTPAALQANIPAGKIVPPAGAALKQKIMSSVLLRSVSSANMFPATLQTIYNCVFSETVPRLKQQGVEYAVWTFKHARADQLKLMAPLILKGITKLIDEFSNDSELDNSEVMMKNFCFQAIEQLAHRLPQLLSSEIDLLERLFNGLHGKSGASRSYVHEACGALVSSFKGCTGQTRERIEKLILSAVESKQDTARSMAVTWACKVFPLDNIPSRIVCIIAAGDKRNDIADEARKGLFASATASGEDQSDVCSAADDAGVSPSGRRFPSRKAMIASLDSRVSSISKIPDSYVAMIRFLQRCDDDEAESGGFDAYIDILRMGLEEDASEAMTTTSLDSMIALFANAIRRADGDTADRSVPKVDVGLRDALARILGHQSHLCRERAASCLGQLSNLNARGRSSGSGGTSELLQSLLASISPTEPNGSVLSARCRPEGAALALGYILCHNELHSDAMAIQRDMRNDCVERLLSLLQSADAEVALAAAVAVGFLAMCGCEMAGTMDGKGDDIEMRDSSIEGDVGARIKVDSEGTSSPIDAYIKLIQNKDVRVARKAAVAAAFFVWGSKQEASSTRLVKELVRLAPVKNEDMHLDVGRALGIVYSGPTQTPSEILNAPSSFHVTDATCTFMSSSDMEEPKMQQRRGPSSQDYAALLAQNPWLGGVQSQILQAIIDENIFHVKEEIRQAACSWLVQLFSMHGQCPSLEPRLPEIQEVLSQLLGDPNEITQEIASYGMSILYDVGGPQTREKLLGSLVSTLSGQAPAKRLVKVDGDTKLFKEGSLGKAKDGGQLSTYKELCNLATELGNPDLMYRFMEMANHKAALSSRRGAAYGFARVIRYAGDELRPYVASLVPKLYRMRYDPNPMISDAMDAILTALVPRTRDAVDENLEAVMTELLREIGARSWRTREACCLALADVLQGRDWHVMGKYMRPMWEMCFRAQDDIKETVRIAAGRLGKSLASATLRMCHADRDRRAAETKSTSEEAEATRLLMPVFLEVGLSSTVGEVVALTMKTMTEIVKFAPADTVRPVAVELIAGLLESLTTLEDSRISYVEQHAERIGGSELKEKYESARVAASNRSPMGEALDRLARIIDDSVVADVMPKLASMCAHGVGLNTRVGTLRFIVSVANSAGPAGTLKSTAASTIRTLFLSAKSDNSASERRARASAIAHIARYAPSSSVKVLVDGCMRALEEDGDSDERDCLVMSAIIRELHRAAPDAARAHQNAILPMAFILKHDSKEEIKALWQDVWEDTAPVPSAAFQLYRREILSLVYDALRSNRWTKKAQACAAIETLAREDKGLRGDELMVPELVSALLRDGLGGRQWDGKDKVPDSLRTICENLVNERNNTVETARAIGDALVDALKKKKGAQFKVACLGALSSATVAFECDAYVDIFRDILLDAMRRAEPEAANREDSSDEPERTHLPALPSVTCLTHMVRHTCLGIDDEALVEETGRLLGPGFAWTIRLGALDLADAMITRGSSAAETCGSVARLLKLSLSTASEGRYSKMRMAMLRVVESTSRRLEDASFGKGMLTSEPELAPAVISTLVQLQGDRVPEVSASASEKLKDFRARLDALET